MKFDIHLDGVSHSVELLLPPGKAAPLANAAAKANVTIDGLDLAFDAVQIAPGLYSVLLNGRSYEIRVEGASDSIVLWAGGREFHTKSFDPRSLHRARTGSVELQGAQQVTAPMPGKIVRVLVAAGQSVKAGEGLLVVEAMKMQNEIRASKSGTIERLSAQEGQTVRAGEVLAVIS